MLHSDEAITHYWIALKKAVAKIKMEQQQPSDDIFFKTLIMKLLPVRIGNC